MMEKDVGIMNGVAVIGTSMIDLVAVSYTHIDVYKRQEQTGGAA